MSGRDMRSAGISAKPSGASTDIAMPMASTRPFRVISPKPSRFALASRRTTSPHHARSNPAVPAAHEVTRLSISNWRICRARPAPRAERTASSRPRDVACARMMLEVFAHAMQNTIIATSESR